MANANLTQALEKNAAVLERVQKESGVNVQDCYQCGKCSAGCPVAFAMDLSPRQVIRYMQLGLWDEVLKSRTVWLCASCHTCVTRCPQKVDLPTLMEVIHQEAKRQGVISVKEVDIFHKLFLANVRRFGKSHEMFLSGFFNLFSGHFMQDVPSAPHLYFNGKVRIRPHTSQDKAAIQKIFQKSLQERGDK